LLEYTAQFNTYKTCLNAGFFSPNEYYQCQFALFFLKLDHFK